MEGMSDIYNDDEDARREGHALTSACSSGVKASRLVTVDMIMAM
jgi:hypothetical protein